MTAKDAKEKLRHLPKVRESQELLKHSLDPATHTAASLLPWTNQQKEKKNRLKERGLLESIKEMKEVEIYDCYKDLTIQY